MSSKSRFRFLRSLAFRLTLTYTLLCATTFLAVSVIFYLALKSTLQSGLDEGLLNELEEYGALLETQDIEILRDVLDREAASEGTDRVFFRVFGPSGEEVHSTDFTAWKDISVSRPHLLAAYEGDTVFDAHRHDSRENPVRIVYGPLRNGYILQLGESTASNAQVLLHFRRLFEAGVVVMVVCSVMVGGFMARRALSGVQWVAKAARDIASGGWDSRVPVSRRQDEIDNLAVAFNEMADRIQKLIVEMKEVSDDIAHDLRTPIARLRVAAEASVSRNGDDKQEEELASHVVEECDHLLELINTMLEIAQTEAGARRLSRDPLDVAALVEDVCEFFSPAAEDKRIDLSFHGDGGLVVRGDAGRLKRAFANLLDNALKFTDAGGRVEVECARQNGVVSVSVRDSGVGVSEDEIERVFARFYRGDKSRTRGGSGLGLSLSRAIVRAHGGDIELKSRSGHGSLFTVTLPWAG